MKSQKYVYGYRLLAEAMTSDSGISGMGNVSEHPSQIFGPQIPWTDQLLPYTRLWIVFHVSIFYPSVLNVTILILEQIYQTITLQIQAIVYATQFQKE